MISGKLPFLIFLFSCIILTVLGRKERACRSNGDCIGPHEECYNGICHCEPGALSWDGGDCLTKRQFGEPCTDSNQCLMSGDAHMECSEVSSLSTGKGPRII